MENIFKVYNGSLYKNGCIIEDIGFIIDKEGGLIKFGDNKDGELSEYFFDMISTYKKIGLSDIADGLFLVSFDKYQGILSIEEICTFSNYVFMCSNNGDTILKMMSDVVFFKNKIKELSEIGY